ncbi:hypothetical protein EYC84_003784 [Monilinia fructicola]|uniref:Uncharacterized protein n=1 Tax=Monilinia fructicola TaxID=38448 RepID=A0A5M9JZI9_MONFR|nr:hypothetical protein EYC84_003784 [Monilinia fructicola]
MQPFIHSSRIFTVPVGLYPTSNIQRSTFNIQRLSFISQPNPILLQLLGTQLLNITKHPNYIKSNMPLRRPYLGDSQLVIIPSTSNDAIHQ